MRDQVLLHYLYQPLVSIMINYELTLFGFVLLLVLSAVSIAVLESSSYDVRCVGYQTSRKDEHPVVRIFITLSPFDSLKRIVFFLLVLECGWSGFISGESGTFDIHSHRLARLLANVESRTSYRENSVIS